MGKKLNVLLEEYGESHQNVTNKHIHWCCVPLIFWSIIALLYAIPNALLVKLLGDHFFSNWAVIAMIPVLVYYLTLSFQITVGMLAFITVCLVSSEIFIQNNSFPLWSIATLVFILAWIGQFYGHKVEGKKPSFLKDILFLLIGPAWLLHFIYKRLGVNF